MKHKKTLVKSVKILSASLFLLPIFSIGFLFPVKVVAENRNLVGDYMLVAVSPVNPLNPAEDVTPIDTPDSSREHTTAGTDVSQVQYPEETTASSSQESQSTEKETVETKPTDVKQPQKKEPKKAKKKNFLKLSEISDYQTTLKNIDLGETPDPVIGPSGNVSPQTYTGRALASLSGTLLYGQKSTYSRS